MKTGVLNGLNPGATLIVREVRTVKGYQLNGAAQTIAVGDGSGVTTPATAVSSATTGTAIGNIFTFYDAPLSVLVVHSYVDGTDNQPLPGVGFKVTGSDGAAVGPDGGIYYADENGDITLRDLEPGVTLTVREVKTVDGYVLNGRPQQIVIQSGDVQNLTFWNTTKQTLTIQALVDGSTNPIQGVKFLVTDSKGAPVGNTNGEHVTDENGRIALSDLTPGTIITAKEIRVADGYAENSEPKSITIQSGEAQVLTFYNAPAGTLVVELRDSATDAPLKGAEFQIMTDGGEYVANLGGRQSSNGTFVTDENGQIIVTGLQPAALTIREITAPSGYVLDTAAQTARISANNTQTVAFKNTAKQTLTIQAYEAGTTAALQGVHFLVTDSTGAAIGSENGSFVTDENGRIVISDLTPGVTVTAKETESISGYVLNDKAQSILIKSGEAQTLTYYNQRKGGLIVEKRDSATNAPLAGAEFQITTLDGRFVDDNEGKTSTKGIFRTDANGQIVLLNLAPDSYVIRETKAPEGYVLDEESQTVKVGANDTQTIVFKNTEKQSVVIQKFVDGTTEPLSGVTFLVTDASGAPVGSPNGEHVTDANGRIVISGLIPGTTLLVREVRTVKGYTLNGAVQTIVVGNGGTGSNAAPGTTGAGGVTGSGNTFTFFDAPLSTLVIQKYITGTTTPIKGVRFLITDQTGAYLGNSNGEFSTDENGRIVLENLEPGTVITAKEIKAADGFVLDSDPKSITIKSGDVQELVFENSPTQTLTIRKYIEGTTTPIKGVTFYVTDQTGAPLGSSNGEFLTDENGSIVLSGLTPGMTVTAKETKPAEGFVLDSAPKSITIKSGEAQTLNFYNAATASLIITKRDKATDKPLKGAEFQIMTDSGEYVSNGKVSSNGLFTTDDKGQIVLTGLQPATLVVKETKAPNGYLLDDTPQTVKVSASGTQALTFYNSPMQALTIQKFVTGTTDPIKGVTFLVTDSSGATVGPNNGEYTTDRNGRISITGLTPGTTITAKEIHAAEGFVLDSAPQSILVKEGESQTLTFFNTAEGGMELIKVDAADKSKRIPDTTFEVRRMDQGLVTTVTTDRTGRVHVDLDAGDYYLVEIEAAKGYKIDATPVYFTVTDGKTTTVTVTNKAESGILIRKIDASTGKGIYGVTFLLYDAKNNPLGQYTSDNQGYVRIEGIDAGRYQLRELENPGYIPDTQMKTIEVKSGETTLIEWKNTPITAQIQITKKSADYNPVNGLPEGTLLEGAVFEIRDKAGNLVDTIQSDNRGVAASKLLPLDRYTIREVKAPANYGINENELTAYLEHEGQIVRFEVTDKSLIMGVNITKTGPKEVMPGQPVRYQFSGIANTSNVRLDSFYWRDTLPAEVRLETVVTGTYNFPGTYKITYRVNGGEPRTLADNLSTSRSYTLAASAVALGLASNERVTEIMFVFGQAPAGFAQVEAPRIDCTVVSGTSSASFVNVADVGGVYGDQWVQGVSRWVTTIYKKFTPLPRTGY